MIQLKKEWVLEAIKEAQEMERKNPTAFADGYLTGIKDLLFVGMTSEEEYDELMREARN